MRSVALLAVVTLAADDCARAQAVAPPANELQQHYDAAQNFQAAGKLEQASREYRSFLAEAQRRIATARASAEGAAKALGALQEASSLVPNDPALDLEYAQACLAAGDIENAKTLAATRVQQDPKSVKAHLVLGEALSRLNEDDAAKTQLETAVALESTFETGYALAEEYLKLKDTDRARQIFEEMRAGFGDTAELHQQFGTAYASTGFAESAIEEFRRAISKDESIRGAHYSLGAAYLTGKGEAAYPEAEAAFRAELRLYPDDALSRFQLGRILLARHHVEDAEKELRRADELDPQNPDILFQLGQLYYETNRLAEAESALQQSIGQTTDVTRSNYQAQRAHYLLARILLRTGHADAGQAEMRVSEQLLQQSVAENQGKPANLLTQETARAKSQPWQAIDPAARKKLEALERRLGPAIADSYNNLGAIAANRDELPTAVHYFQNAAEWDPNLEGLDFNWGKAAFQAGQFQNAIAPLRRFMSTHPDDAWVRAALGTSLFATEHYADARQVLEPIESQVLANPRLAFAYAICLAKTGNVNRAVEELSKLAQSDPNSADIHRALGELLAKQGDHSRAADELSAALRLRPNDTEAKFQLALSLIRLQRRRDEAEKLLTELAGAGSHDPDVFYQLGRLQLEQNDTKSAMANLETAERLGPNRDYIHHALAEVYREQARTADAEREMKLYRDTQDVSAKH